MQFKEIRKENGFTQQRLAQELNVKQSTIAMWETGKAVPCTKNLSILSELLGVSMSDLWKSFPKRSTP